MKPDFYMFEYSTKTCKRKRISYAACSWKSAIRRFKKNVRCTKLLGSWKVSQTQRRRQMAKKKKMAIVSAAASTAVLAAIIVGAAATAVVLAGCAKVENDKDIDRAWTCHGNDCYTKVVEVDGHAYIIMDGFYSGGIIHAASCRCMNK